MAARRVTTATIRSLACPTVCICSSAGRTAAARVIREAVWRSVNRSPQHFMPYAWMRNPRVPIGGNGSRSGLKLVRFKSSSRRFSKAGTSSALSGVSSAEMYRLPWDPGCEQATAISCWPSRRDLPSALMKSVSATVPQNGQVASPRSEPADGSNLKAFTEFASMTSK